MDNHVPPPDLLPAIPYTPKVIDLFMIGIQTKVSVTVSTLGSSVMSSTSTLQMGILDSGTVVVLDSRASDYDFLVALSQGT